MSSGESPVEFLVLPQDTLDCLLEVGSRRRAERDAAAAGIHLHVVDGHLLAVLEKRLQAKGADLVFDFVEQAKHLPVDDLLEFSELLPQRLRRASQVDVSSEEAVLFVNRGSRHDVTIAIHELYRSYG